MTDFNLYLPEGVGMTKIAIVPSFKDMHPLIQRAVCLMVAHESSGLTINDIPIMSFIQQTSNTDTASLAQMLTPVADQLQQLLNDEEVVVSSLYFSVRSENGRLYVDINITPMSVEESVSSVIYSR